MVTKVSTQGRITIPKKIRDRLGLKPGMVVEVFLNEDSQIVLSSSETKRKQSHVSNHRFNSHKIWLSTVTSELQTSC